ncbi:MAG: orotate phosphoribosyltransferase, partial [Promethearchaeota archaeon]
IKEIIIKILEETGAIKFGEFTLASGVKSKYYIDLRVIPNYPDVFEKLIGFAIVYIKKNIKCDGVVAVPIAGIPFGTMIAYQLHKPFYILRKEPKKHGLKKLVEGKIEKGEKILLVDDLISNGYSKLFAINALREEGANVKNLFVFINRSIGNLVDFEKEHKIKVHSLLNIKDFKNII